MGVLSNTGTLVPVVNAEQQIAVIAGGPFDNISVYFQGGQFGAGGALQLNLYATVSGVLTRVAQAQVMGSRDGTLVEWLLPGGPDQGPPETTNVVSAAGTAYSVTIEDLSAALPPPGSPPRGAATVTLAAVNQFDNAADAVASFTGALAANSIQALATLAGWAQSLDVALSQQDLPLVEVTVSADCGVGSVAADVANVKMSGAGTGPVAQVFRKLALPVFTRLFVSVSNLSATAAGALSLTAATTSINTLAGGVVTLAGNAIGPSNANETVDFLIESTDANVLAAAFVGPEGQTSGSWYVGLAGLTANRTVTVPDMTSGSTIKIKDEDGSLGKGFTITVQSATGKTIDGQPSYVMSLAQNGSFGEITIEMNARAPTEWQVV